MYSRSYLSDLINIRLITFTATIQKFVTVKGLGKPDRKADSQLHYQSITVMKEVKNWIKLWGLDAFLGRAYFPLNLKMFLNPIIQTQSEYPGDFWSSGKSKALTLQSYTFK